MSRPTRENPLIECVFEMSTKDKLIQNVLSDSKHRIPESISHIELPSSKISRRILARVQRQVRTRDTDTMIKQLTHASDMVPPHGSVVLDLWIPSIVLCKISERGLSISTTRGETYEVCDAHETRCVKMKRKSVTY